MSIEERMIEYALKWYTEHGFITEKKNGSDLYLHLSENVITEVSHSDIRQKAILWLESEIEGVKNG